MGILILILILCLTMAKFASICTGCSLLALFVHIVLVVSLIITRNNFAKKVSQGGVIGVAESVELAPLSHIALLGVPTFAVQQRQEEAAHKDLQATTTRAQTSTAAPSSRGNFGCMADDKNCENERAVMILALVIGGLALCLCVTQVLTMICVRQKTKAGTGAGLYFVMTGLVFYGIVIALMTLGVISSWDNEENNIGLLKAIAPEVGKAAETYVWTVRAASFFGDFVCLVVLTWWIVAMTTCCGIQVDSSVKMRSVNNAAVNNYYAQQPQQFHASQPGGYDKAGRQPLLANDGNDDDYEGGGGFV